MNPASIFLAHVYKTENGKWLEHLLEEHLRAVSTLASQFAKTFGASDWASLAGLWHDIGKYQARFQTYIKNTSGYDPDAHIEIQSRVDHSTAGAIHAVKQLGSSGRILAYLIAGHHAGLPDWVSEEAGQSALLQRLEKQQLLTDTLVQPIPEDIRQGRFPTSKPAKGTDPALWIRMLFSCLADADFLDTETFMDPDRANSRTGYPSLDTLLPGFASYMEQLAAKAPDTPVNRLRASILRRCQEQANQAPGLFSLTVPTGGGKTLSSLAFALRHAL